MYASIAATVALAAVTNGALAAFGLNRRSDEVWPAFAPPGHTIGLVWIALFALMGAALWLVARRPSGRDDARAIGLLIALCLAYPFYTHVVGGHAIELAGNLVTFAFAATIVVRLRSVPLAAAMIGAVAAWVAFATVLVIALVSLNGWRT